jgi:hypothetical protein
MAKATPSRLAIETDTRFHDHARATQMLADMLVHISIGQAAEGGRVKLSGVTIE